MKMKMSGNNAVAFSISLSEKPHVLARPPPGLSFHFVASNKRRLPLIIVITPSPSPLPPTLTPGSGYMYVFYSHNILKRRNPSNYITILKKFLSENVT